MEKKISLRLNVHGCLLDTLEYLPSMKNTKMLFIIAAVSTILDLLSAKLKKAMNDEKKIAMSAPVSNHKSM